jgi:putative transposase
MIGAFGTFACSAIRENSTELVQLTYKFRLRDKHRSELKRQSRAVNFVWNFCNQTQRTAARSSRKWLSGYDLEKLAAGTSKDLDLHAHTIAKTCSQYARSREQHKRPWLRWRGKKSLGWVPFNTGHVTFDGKAFVFRGVRYEPMHLRGLLPGAKFGAGSFSADSRGRWYINVPVEVECAAAAPNGEVGIDLVLKTLATLSNGEVVATPSFYRKSEASLATAQRARRSKRTRTIHTKVRNRRKDLLHQASAKIARENGLIIVGDVSPSKIAKTRMGKSSLDAGWADFKTMLSYKSMRNGGTFFEVAEAYSTQACSTCGALPASRPRGIAGLRIREWACSECGAVHDRDVNAARNILRAGRRALVGGAHAA